MRRSALLLLLAAAANMLETPLAAQAPARKVAAAVPDPAGFTVMEARTRNGAIIPIARLNGVFLIMQGANPENERVVDEDVEGDANAQDDEMIRSRPTIQFSNGTLDEFVFGKGAGSTTAKSVDGELKDALHNAIEKVDAVCQLTPPQRRKLELAGRGDIKRFLDRLDRLKAALQQPESIRTTRQFRDWVTPLGQEGETLRRMLGHGVFGNNSLFDKTRKFILSSEQSEQSALPGPRASRVPDIPGDASSSTGMDLSRPKAP